MTTISSRFGETSLMSPRTAKYVEAMIREGDNFDYNRWLKEVREEEAQAKLVPTGITPRDVVAAQADNPISTSDSKDARPRLGSPLLSRPGLSQRASRWPHRQAKSQTPKDRLRRWLEKVRLAWDDFQSSREIACTVIWKRFLPLSYITKYDDGPTGCYGTRSNLPIFRSIRTRTLLGL
jgi:hypothetical protein